MVGSALIACWYLAIALFAIPEYQLPPIHRVVEAGIEESSVLWTGAVQTTIACLVGFFSSVIGAMMLAVWLASSNWAYRGVYTYVLILKMTPIIGIVNETFFGGKRTINILLTNSTVSYTHLTLPTNREV